MTIDPISASIIGGLSVEFARVIWDNTGQRAIDRRYADVGSRALEIATANAKTTADLIALHAARQLEAPSHGGSPERPSMEELLSDPDIALTIRDAILQGARTADPGRQETVARLVAERLSTGSDSDKAAAAKQAISALPHLSSGHLGTLGLLALIYAVRPSINYPLRPIGKTGNEEAFHRFSQELGALSEHFVSWFAEELRAYTPLRRISRLHATQLQSVGCIVIDEVASRDLLKVLSTSGWTNDGVPMSASIRNVILLQPNADEDESSLYDLWRASLSSMRLTPAGLLIGLCVHDVKRGGSYVAAWNWTPDMPLADEDQRTTFLSQLADERKFVDMVTRAVSEEREKNRRALGITSR